MTTSNPTEDAEPRRWPRPWAWPIWSTPLARWAAHADPYVWSAFAVIAVLRHFNDAPPMSVIHAVALVTISPLAIFSKLAHLWHSGNMCLRCGDVMTGTRSQRTLTTWCWIQHNQWAGIMVFVLAFGAQIVLSMPVWVDAMLEVPIMTVLVAYLQAAIMHRANEAFCPWCSGDWGADPDAHPEPVPDPAPGERLSPA